MKKGMLPIALGTAVTATGLAVDSRQNKKNKFRKNDYTNMSGALLVGVGVAHIVLGGMDVMRNQ